MKCKSDIINGKSPCHNQECRNWIDYDEDKNCCLISVDRHGQMTLMQVAKRLGVSHVRIKQIQDKALIKLKKKDRRQD
tara:strand:- start:29 stop:262 length:234 start_codon:yes stop_codon:yes gene_type:complete